MRKMTGAWYEVIWPSTNLASLSRACKVVMLAESQGGQVASKLAPVIRPDLLVLLASVPDIPDVPVLRDEAVQTIIGWKV